MLGPFTSPEFLANNYLPDGIFSKRFHLLDFLFTDPIFFFSIKLNLLKINFWDIFGRETHMYLIPGGKQTIV